MAAIRVLIVDDAPQIRAGLRTLLPLLAEANGLALEIVGEASTGEEALRQVAALRPDLVCLDLEMPETDGLTAAEAIKAHWPEILWILAFIGLASKHLNYRTPGLQRANEAVLPFYILHQPALLCVGFFVVRWAIPDLVKWAIIAASSFVIVVLIYETAVRRFNVMRFLFGMKLKQHRADRLAGAG